MDHIILYPIHPIAIINHILGCDMAEIYKKT